MKIPSYQKIEKQSQKYADDNFIDMPKEWYDKYRKLNSKHKKLQIQWDAIREKCPGNDYGNRCICKTFPEYETLMLNGIEPLVKEINKQYEEKVDKRNSLYLKELRNLQRMREAKEKYCKTR